jgi:hypothetical protein
LPKPTNFVVNFLYDNVSRKQYFSVQRCSSFQAVFHLTLIINHNLHASLLYLQIMVKIKNQKCAWHFCLTERVRSQFAGWQDQRAGGKSPRPGTPGNFPWPNSSRHRQRVKFLRGGSHSKRGSLHLLHKCAIWCSSYSSFARTHTENAQYNIRRGGQLHA